MKLSYILLTLPLLAACGQGDPVIHSVSVSPTTVDAGKEVTLTVDVENFELRMPPSIEGLSPAEEDHHHDGGGAHGDYPDGGHYHIYLDTVETNPLMTNCPEWCMHPAWESTVRVMIPATTKKGDHQLIVRLNMDDHRFLDPPISGMVDLTVTSTID